MDDTLRITYRYLRVAVVALTLLLSVSIALAMAAGARFGSISAAYYSPARAALVGSLVAIGPAMIAIRGRPGEDVVLDLAGMVIPLVALVPAPTALGSGVCGSGIERCVPPDLVPAVVNNVTALIVTGTAVLAFGWTSAARRRAPSVGLVCATAVLVAGSGWFVVSRDTFLGGAHWAAAAVFFVLVAVVAELNARRAAARVRVRMLAPRRFAVAYRVIATAMVAVVLGAAVLLALQALGTVVLPEGSTFAAESALLVMFLTFWVLQTAENWDEEAVDAPRPVAASRSTTRS